MVEGKPTENPAESVMDTYAVLIKLPGWTILRKEVDQETADNIIKNLHQHWIVPVGAAWGIAEELPDSKYRTLASGTK